MKVNDEGEGGLFGSAEDDDDDEMSVGVSKRHRAELNAVRDTGMSLTGFQAKSTSEGYQI